MNANENIRVRNATIGDLDRLAEIEREAFPPLEAASKPSLKYRLENFPEYIFVGECQGKIVGAVICRPTDKKKIVDELYEPEPIPFGKTSAVFSVITDLQYRHQAVAETILNFAIDDMKTKGMERMTLTCKEQLVHYYAKFGFAYQGLSQSVHGGAVWYDMTLELLTQ
ncbi:MAG: GNAT family N-acetyltransferase [Anaerovoracaceae bacterium]